MRQVREDTGSQIDKEAMVWILDIGRTMSRDTHYSKTLDLYWHIKSLLRYVMEK